MVKKKLLAHRKWSGVGDWIMALTVLKMVNRQYPDIDIYLNLVSRNGYAINIWPRKLPKLILEIIREGICN